MDFNQAPYFDDYNELKKFYKILFRPGVAVQTRELNQLQSILQNQVTKFGDHIFKEGSMVIPGQVNYNDKLNYIKISETSLGSNALTWLEGKEISTGLLGTGVKAQVVKAVAAEDADPITLIILYTGSDEGLDGGSGAKTFAAGDILYVTEDQSASVTVQNGADATGRSAAANIQNGIYYLNGYFVNVTEQNLVIEKYITNIASVSYRAGLQYEEVIITEEDDSSLYDNANDTTNYTAPGAHRYKIEATFVRAELTDNPENFFEILRIENGVVQKLINYSQYNILEETLARRTFDESGNYTVEPFRINIKEHRSNNRGAWASQTNYLVGDYILDNGRYFSCVKAGQSALTAPTTFATADETAVIVDNTTYWRYTRSPRSNLGAYTPELGGNSSNLVYAITDGKAYIRGHETFRDQGLNLTVSKSRTLSDTTDQSFPVNNGNYIILDRDATWGLPDVRTGPQVNLYDRQVGDTSYALKFGFGRPVGTARVKYIDRDFSGGLKLGLFDVKMQPNRLLDRDVNMVALVDSSSTVTSKLYKLSGSGFRFTGSSITTSTPITVTGLFAGPGLNSAISSTTFTLTSTTALFTRELTSGDTIFITNTSNSVSSYLVAGITNTTTISVIYQGQTGTSAAFVLTSAAIRLSSNTVFAAGSTPAMAYELREGDTVWLSSSGAYVSGVVTTIYNFDDTGVNRNRITISSAATTAITGADLYVYYEGQAASFVGNILGQYNVGVNATRLTGLFAIKDADGTNTIDPLPHQAVKIVAQGSDARLLSEQLFENDLVEIGGYKLFVTRRLDNISLYGVCLDRQVVTADTSYPAFLLGNKVYDTNDASYLFRVDDTPATITDNSYRIYKTETLSLASATSVLTLTLNTVSNPVEVAWSNAPLDYLVASADTSAISTQYEIRDIVVDVGNITINLTTSISGNVRVVYTVDKEANAGTLGGVKTKTLIYDQTYEALTSSIAKLERIVLPHADVLRINKILMATTFVTSWTTAVAITALDITANYQIDNGQRDAFYDYGALVRNQNSPEPQGSLKIYYDYFDHGAGDFFTFGSYSPSQVPYENIPEYKGLKLRDYLDFRPLIGTTSTLTNVNILRYGSTFTAKTSRYLARKDKIVLDSAAKIYAISSVPAVVPGEVQLAVNSDSLELFDVDLASYTDSSEWPDVIFTAREHQRYTMKDIGRLERRIENLEEVVTLSLLEVATKSLQIRDNKDSTLERYKTGFFVDPFTDQTNADPDTNENRFSINPEEQTMQVHISPYGLPLVEKINYTTYSPAGNEGSGETAPINAARDIQNYQVTGDLLTLPYTTSVLLRQLIATTSIAVAPYIAISFIGSMKVFPSKDIYEDVSTIKINKSNPKNKKRLKEAKELGQKLYGSNYTIDVKTTKKTTTTKIEKTLIPYCRPNTLAVVVTGLKPNTKFYPFIDGQDIRRYTTGAIRFTMNSIDTLLFYYSRPNGKNDWARWRSLAYSLTERRKVRKKRVDVRITKRPKDYDQFLPSTKYGDAFRKAFENGVSIYYQESGRNLGSGVAMYQDQNTLYLVNARGRLSPDYIRTRTAQTYVFSGRWNIAGLSGYFTTLPNFQRTAQQVVSDDTDGNLYSDSLGNLVFTIDFPQDDIQSFFTGQKAVVVSDHPTDNADEFTSRAEATYEVEGYKVVITKTTVTTKTYRPRALPPPDPIAQSFKLPDGYPNGAFITGVDLYFQQTQELANDKPVFLEIRECDATGRPSPNVVPGSVVIKYADEIAPFVDSSTASRAMTFAFDQPIHIKPDVEYAIVAKTDSIRHRVWIATLGQGDVADPTKSYGVQGTLGSLFKSQNNTLWTEDQLSDLKFQLHRAVFNTSVTGVAYLTNQNLPNAPLPTNPFIFMHGSAKVRVSHPNHGFRNGDLVRYSSINYTNLYNVSSGTTIAGIPVTEIFGSTIAEEQTASTDPVLTVESCTLDDYVISTTTLAYLSDSAVTGETLRVDGGSDVFANSQVLYHIMTPQLDIINFETTGIDLTGYMVEGHTYDNLPATGYTQYNNGLDINVTNVENSRPKVILTDLNELQRYSGVTITAGTGSEVWYDSFIGRLQLNSVNDQVSPVVDLSSAYLNVIQHRIDNPTRASRLGGNTLPPYGTTSTFIVYKTIVSSSTAISFNANDSSIVAQAGVFDGVVPGRYITIQGSPNVLNNNTSTGVLVTNVNLDASRIFVNAPLIDEAAGNAITIRQLQDFTEEATTTDASGESKYITRKINLENPATQIKILIDVNVPTDADFDLYYKLGSAAQDFDNLVWVKYNNLPTVNKENDRLVFTEFQVDLSNFDSGGAPIDLPEFTAFQFKIVMRSTNAARIPSFKNLRVIAHA
jgi:hypothetical protein